MTRTSLALVHDSSASAFDPSALRDADGEPRVRDLELAHRLGFTDPHKIRALIARNAGELSTHGEISATAAENTDPSGRGRPGKEYWLNEGQALVICALSRTPQAALVRKAVIEVFLAYRRGQLPVEHEAAQTLAHLASEVAELRQRVALIGAAPHVRPKYKGAWLPGTVALTVSDLSTAQDSEPRVYDERVGVQLGFRDPLPVRNLVRSHRAALSGLGRILSSSGAAPARGNHGRPLVGYWLTEMQALAVCDLVSGNVASATRTRILRVFAEFRRGREEIATGGGFIALQERDRVIAEMRERIDALEADAQAAAERTAQPTARLPRPSEVTATDQLEGALLVGVPDIARFLGMRESQARHRCSRGLIPSFRIGSTICVRKVTLERWMADQEVAAAIKAGRR